MCSCRPAALLVLTVRSTREEKQMTTMRVTKTDDSYTARHGVWYFTNKEQVREAVEFEAAHKFPKSCRVALTADVDDSGRRYMYFGINVKLSADSSNGGVNETGMKRIAAFEKAAAKLGIELAE
ncbi:hypothetical protein BARRETLEMON_76 [Arthrobacter phage BarretLemon]|uniref:Uncharacterized protein n=1 Tax=Arthrobacter phage BarretLemon TaxID=1796994 RepID=A0A127AVK0_9CAUD|nr:hypothetical protein BJD79_gp76 [Arthrobacter phage BarretLemon]AMM44538.1 hypothetical protein BARRETLEMON_76 [Arthrobacter phage BarretLemon]